MSTETWVAYIVGVDDAGPYEIMGDDSESDETPESAFYSVHGFWDEVVGSHRKMHIRIFNGDEYVYAWEPGNPDVLVGIYTDEIIDLKGNRE